MRGWTAWHLNSRGERLVVAVALALAAQAGMAPEAGAQQRPDTTQKKPLRTGITAVASQAVSSILAQVPRMPDVRGMTLDSARRVLAPLYPAESLAYRDTTDARSDGRVADQSPAPGAAVRRRLTPVQLTVYRFTPDSSTTVPGVKGLPLAGAWRAITDAHLVPRVGSKAVRMRQAIVVAQSPDSGTSVPAGSTVTLTVEFRPVVPDVRGNDRAVADRRIAGQGLVMVARGEEYDDSISAGRVVRQHPDTGALASLGDSIEVWLSKGAHPVEPPFAMPPLVGRTLEQAGAIVQKVQLQLVHVDSVVDAARAGTITEQVPQERDPVHRGDAVTVVVAVAPTTHKVPWVVGRMWEAGSAMMKGAGFVARERDSTTSTATPGKILRQSVDSGQSLALGSTVTLTVADGGVTPPPVRTMPDVYGLTVTEATERLGFLLPVITEAHEKTSNPGEDGRVTGQVPARGEPVVAPVRVVLRVGRFERPTGTTGVAGDSVLVPRLTAQTIYAARALLRQAGLALGTVEGTLVGTDSLVASQTPDAGTPLARGSSVRVVLAPAEQGGGGTIDWWKVFEIVAGLTAGGLILYRLIPPPPPPVRVHLTNTDDVGGEVRHPTDTSLVAFDVRLVDATPETTLELDPTAPLIERTEVRDAPRP